MLRNVILWIIWYSELTNFELKRFSHTPELLHYAFISLLKWIYIHIAHLRQQCYNSKSVIFQEKCLKVLKCCNFLWMQRRHNCSPAASFANCVMTLYLLTVHLQTFLSIPITQKCQILSCDTFVANERYVYKSNCIHSILIKTINNDTLKQYVETVVLVHAFISNGNTLTLILLMWRKW